MQELFMILFYVPVVKDVQTSTCNIDTVVVHGVSNMTKAVLTCSLGV